MQSAYLLKAIRKNDDVSHMAQNCLMCGRCDQKCPVGIELSPIRMIQRRMEDSENDFRTVYKGYFRSQQRPEPVKPVMPPSFGFIPEAEPKKVDVVYFAGCMSHLTPGIKNSMVKILNASGLSYSFIDEAGGICCGRPMMLAGLDREARELINLNSQLIWKTGARTLVTSCPICYKVFKESYYLDVEVLHHSQFIGNLIRENTVKFNFLRKRVVFHTPCELGRGSGVYDEPKEVLSHIAKLEKSKFEDQNSLCCGGSLGNLKIDSRDRIRIATQTAAELTKGDPDILATACPLCKKTLSAVTGTRVADIAEIAAEALVIPRQQRNIAKQIRIIKELADIS
jgi:Fe-S oxidoreductase